MEWRTGPGYQKAMERGNSVARLNKISEADNVICLPVLLQNTKCRYLRVTNTKILYDVRKVPISVFGKL